MKNNQSNSNVNRDEETIDAITLVKRVWIKKKLVFKVAVVVSEVEIIFVGEAPLSKSLLLVGT